MLRDKDRYSCQVALPDFGEEAQSHLQRSKVLIVGMGGLGCPAAQYLAAAGIGTLGIADFDTISISNLHRQILYDETEVGEKKVNVAQDKLKKLNSRIEIKAHDVRVDSDNIMSLIGDYDVVVDATDNFETHYLVNDACVMAGIPLVHGAIYQYEGHLAVWNMQNEDGTRSPNYRDVFPAVNALQIPDCSDGGVLPTIAGIIGCMQANEVIKIVTNSADVLAGKLLVFDAKSMQSRIINIGAKSKVLIGGQNPSLCVPVIGKEEIIALLDKHDVLVVDVRTEEEHSAFNIGGRNIPIGIIESRLQDFVEDKQYVFYCASGKRSLQAAKWLKDKIPAVKVFSLEGGIKDW